MIWTDSLDPILLSLGPVQLHWYGLMYALAFLFGYLFFQHAAKVKRINLTPDQIEYLLFAIFLGVVVGGRLGYFLFYAWETLLTDPFQILRIWEGGMSFHGGLLGVALALLWITRKFKIKLFELADLLLIPVALGLFFGRIGNFINGELWGVPTGSDWGVVFPLAGDSLARHPSQLYEALYSLIIFGILYFLFRRRVQLGVITFTFLSLYGFSRILVEEYWREPLDGFIGPLTVGQFWSVPVLVVGIIGLAWISRENLSSRARL